MVPDDWRRGSQDKSRSRMDVLATYPCMTRQERDAVMPRIPPNKHQRDDAYDIVANGS